MNKDMTVGSPGKLILLFAVPLFIGNIFQQLYSMVDAIIVGQFVSVDALAAVGVTMPLTFLILGFVQGLTSGFAVIVSQRFGANDDKGLKQAVATSLILSVVAIAVITLISLLTIKPLLRLMNTPDAIFDDATIYLVIIFSCLFGSFFYNLVSGIVRAIGDSKTPLIFLVVACIINIVLDFVFIVGLNMGVAGAALATVLSQILAGVGCTIYAWRRYPILRIHREDFKTSSELIWQQLRLGLPMAFQFSICAVGVMILQSVLNKFGSGTIAAYTAASRLEDLAGQPLSSISVAVATYVAQNYGAGKMERIREGVRKASVISIIFAVSSAVILAFFAEPFTRLFISDGNQAVVDQAKQYIHIIAGFLPILGLLFVHRNALQGIGSGFIPMVASGAELLLRVVAAYSLVSLWGFTGICLTNPIAWIGAELLLAIKYFIEIRKLCGKRPKKLAQLENV